jgi:hypothetical protein
VDENGKYLLLESNEFQEPVSIIDEFVPRAVNDLRIVTNYHLGIWSSGSSMIVGIWMIFLAGLPSRKNQCHEGQ